MKELIALIVVVLMIIGGSYWFRSSSCEVKGQSFDEVRFTVVGGCMVKQGDKWLPLSNIRSFD